MHAVRDLIHRSCGAALTALLLLVDPAHAQVSGRVVSSVGEPLPGATIELWRDGRLAGRALAGSNGSFRIDAPPEAGWLSVRMIGHAPRHLSLEGRGGELTIELPSSPVQLGELVTAAAVPCPRSNDPASVRWWHAATAATRDRLASAAYVTAFTMVNGSGDRAAVTGRLRGDTARGSLGASSTILRFRARERDAAGFAARAPAGLSVGGVEGGRWRFIRLWALELPLLADTAFLATHRLGPRDAAGYLRLCPASDRRVGLDGHIRIDDDSALVELSWRLTGGGFDEEAGASVVLAPGLGLLLPATSRVWRSDDGRRFHVQDLQFDRWILGAERDLQRLQRDSTGG